MTDHSTPPTDQPGSTGPAADETQTGSGGTTASSVVDSLRSAFEELAERAGPTVKELSAKAAEITAAAADKAVPLARKAGEATADASGKLAVKSRGWAHDLREAEDGSEGTTASAADTDGAATSAADTVGDAASDTSHAATDTIDDANAGR
jgi:hypothetical protein